MRKDILLGVFLTMSVCSAPTRAQQLAEPSVNISPGFAGAGLDATRAIRQCRGTMFLTEGGVAVPPNTQRVIDLAEKAAKTDADRAVVDTLKALLQARMNTNMGRAIASMYGSSTDCHDRFVRQLDTDEAIAESELQQRQCRSAIRFILRRRVYLGMPAQCRNIPRWDPGVVGAQPGSDRQ